MEVQPQPQQQEEQEQPQPQQDNPFCCICVQNERMQQNPCPGRQSSFEVPCGHHVHFLCLFAESTINDFIGQCPICNVPFFPIEQVAWVVNYLDRFDTDNDTEEDEHFIGPRQRPSQKTIQEVWNSEPQFRKEVKALKQVQVKFGKARREFKKEHSDLRKKFNEETKHSVDYLKDVKSKYTKLYTQNKNRRSALAYKALFFRRQRDILQKYGLGHLKNMNGLRDIRYAPRIKSRHEMYMNRHIRLAYWAFRIRV
jgi:hypothetical protein